jgi:hypothetical protein
LPILVTWPGSPAEDCTRRAAVESGSVDARGEEAIRQTGELTGLTLEQIRTVARYFAEYRSEIDDWLRRVDEDAQRAEASWRRTREPLFS